MNYFSTLSPRTSRHTTRRTSRRLRVFSQAWLGALAVMALTACGGGTADEPDASATTGPAAAAQPMRAPAASTVVMTKVNFTNADGQALTGFMFKDPTVTAKNAAVVMMHGCSGVWSKGVVSTDAQPVIGALSHIHKRWGENLAKAGYVGLLVDSFTSRNLTNECNNGTAGLNEATVRPKDALAGRNWLIGNGQVTAERIALMGWSNGGSAVMATMDVTNQGNSGIKPFKEAFSFYPGCGLINEFGGDASTPAATSWLPYAPITIHHAETDPLYTSTRCENRKTTAIALGASPATGNKVDMVVYTAARHSFDQVDLTKAIAAPYTQADNDAQAAADASVMSRLSAIFGN